MPDFAMPEELETEESHVGRRMLRVEDHPLLKGRGQFVDDVPIKKGTLHAAFLRSPHAHAEIVSIDYSEALKMPGVYAVVTGEDMARETDPLIVGFKNPIDYHGLAIDKARYVGEPVAVVAASDRYKAEDAIDLIKVEYKVLPAAVDPVEAAEPSAPLIHPRSDSNCASKRHFVHGDPDAAFAEADRRAEMTIRYPRNSITPMETYAVVTEHIEETGGFDVLSNFQGPFSVHTVMALALRIRTASLRHRSPKNSGGSFGSKLVIFPYIVVLCVLARKAGRPVKWIEDRLEHLSASSVAPNRVTKVEAAYNNDGKVNGLRLTHWDDHGAYLRAPMPAPIYRMHGVSTNGYDIRNLEVTNHIMITNKCPTGAVRGFGGPQLYFGVERMMHKIAVDLGMDPLDLIRRNLVTADQFPYKAIAGALLDSGDFHRTVDETVDEGDLADLMKRRDAARAEGRLYGIGYAACVEPSQSNMGYISTLKTGIERERAGPKDGAVASVTVSVDALGSVNVIGDSVPQGQGHQTALAQIVADQLGLDPRDIVVSLDTDTAKDGWSIAAGNYSCRFAPASASAAHQAATRVREKMARIAATTLNVPPSEVDFSNGNIHAKSNPDNAIPFYRVGGLAHWSPSSLPEGMEPAIRETSMWNAPELTPTTANDEINTSLAYGFGFDFCGVEIDANTGVIRVDKYVSAHDCGTILNPGLAEGQIRGSWASSYGATVLEEFCYDADGSFQSGTFAEYLVPTAAELPDFTLV
ncbi:MAG: xanthine dehydrogenase family protein molybdopterin-binding subunit, partial [Pseudomonadota bacterium]